MKSFRVSSAQLQCALGLLRLPAAGFRVALNQLMKLIRTAAAMSSALVTSLSPRRSSSMKKDGGLSSFSALIAKPICLASPQDATIFPFPTLELTPDMKICSLGVKGDFFPGGVDPVVIAKFPSVPELSAFIEVFR